MGNIRVLFLDNDKNMFEIFWDNIESNWRDLYEDTLECDFVQTTKEARSRLEMPSETYQIFIADMLFPPLLNPNAEAESHEPLGIEAIKVARKKEKLLIVAISIGSSQGYPNLKDEAIEAGAHIFKYRSELTKRPERAFPDFCEEVHEQLLREGIIPDSVQLEHKRDPQVDYVIAEVGEKTLKSLYKQVLRGKILPETIRATYLTPGLSGAFVLKMEADQENKPVLRHLLKVARDREILSKEIKNYPGAGVYSSTLLVRYVDMDESKIAQVNNWNAIAAVFEEDAKSLRDWLLLSSNTDKVSSVMSSLFLDGGLSRGYETWDRSIQQCAIVSLSPNGSRRARILTALTNYKNLILHPELGQDPRWKAKDAALTQFLKLKRVKDVSVEEDVESCYRCLSHGDLHSRNVLVTKGGTPKALIIDTAEFSTYHWATDYARLLVDLLVTIFDYGIRSYQWANIQYWMSLSQAVIGREALPAPRGIKPTVSGESNEAVREAIKWLIENLPAVCPAVTSDEDMKRRRWELELCLAVEFMRSAYRVDLTDPKRIFALRSSYSAVSAAESSFKKVIRR